LHATLGKYSCREEFGNKDSPISETILVKFGDNSSEFHHSTWGLITQSRQIIIKTSRDATNAIKMGVKIKTQK
jgi:hypothetical protein